MLLNRRFVIVFFLTAALGTGLHFLYDVCPNPLFALVAPINESVWEHGKLFFWPFAAAGWYLYRRGAGLGGLLAAELLMPAVMLGAYYALCFGLSVEGLAGLILRIAIAKAAHFRARRACWPCSCA